MELTLACGIRGSMPPSNFQENIALFESTGNALAMPLVLRVSMGDGNHISHEKKNYMWLSKIFQPSARSFCNDATYTS